MGLPTSTTFEIIPKTDVSLVHRHLVQDADEATARQRLLGLERIRNESSSDVDRIGLPDLDDAAGRLGFSDDPSVEIGSVKNRLHSPDVEAADVADPLRRDLVPHVLLQVYVIL